MRDRQGRCTRLCRYTFSNSIGVTIKDVSEAAVGTLLEAVVEAGQNSLSIDRVTFSLSSDHSYELTVEARKQASLDALQTAKQYAEVREARRQSLLVKNPVNADRVGIVTCHGSRQCQHVMRCRTLDWPSEVCTPSGTRALEPHPSHDMELRKS